MSCCCHATHNIPFLYAQIKWLYYSTRRLIRQLIAQVLYWVDPILRVNAWDDLSNDTNVLALRASSTSVHAVVPQVVSHSVPHMIFDDVEERESKERGRGRCLAKQPPHARNNYLMRQLHNHCMGCCCHATHNIPFLCAQIKELYRSTRRLTRQLNV
jgi:hypothetical protein